MASRVISVGQCGADHMWISSVLKNQFGSQVQGVDNLADVQAAVGQGTIDLILVNRILDRDGSPGLEVIKSLKQDRETAEIPIMLVSNYPEAQQSAVEAGALPGFGKSALRDPETHQRLQEVLGQ